MRLLAGAVALSLVAQPANALPNEQSLAQRIDQAIAPYVAAGMFSGVVLIMEGDRVVLERAYGMANYELGVPMRANMRFRIASLTKQFTQAALAVLMDSGRIGMDTRVSDLLPEFPRGSEITVRHILTETSGIPHTNDLPEFERATRMTLARAVEILATKPLAYDPGTGSGYSNGAYDVLAAMIERAAGRPFRQFMQEAVFAPLGLRDTGWVETYAVIPGMAEGYAPGWRPGERARVRFYAPEIRPGGGSLYSTARDVERVMRAAYGPGDFISAETRRQIFGDNPQGRYHAVGRAPGFYSAFLTDQGRGVRIVVLANSYTFFDLIHRRLYLTAIGEGRAAEDLGIVPRRLAPADVARYAGDYQFGDSPVTISDDGTGHLIYEDRDSDWRAALVPLSGGRWLHPMFDRICEFQGEPRAAALVCRSVEIGRDSAMEIRRRG